MKILILKESLVGLNKKRGDIEMGIIINTVDIFIRFLNFLILMRIIFSFVRIDKYNKLYSIVFQLTEPILEPIRRVMVKSGIETGMIDFSPLVASLLLSYIVRPVLYSLLKLFL